MLPVWAQVLLPLVGVIGGVAGSNGFWLWLQRKDETKKNQDRLVRGLAYREIVSLGLEHIARGSITDDEYKEFREYLYKPYLALGGNGVTERIMAEIMNLPLKPREAYVTVIQEAKTRSTLRDQSLNAELVGAQSNVQ